MEGEEGGRWVGVCQYFYTFKLNLFFLLFCCHQKLDILRSEKDLESSEIGILNKEIMLNK